MTKEILEDSVDVQEKTSAKTVKKAHDDFDWHIGNKFSLPYKDSELKKYEDEYESTFKAIGEQQIVTGKVVGVTKNDVVLNIGFKSDGLIPLSEFKDIEHLKEGDEVEVFVIAKEDKKGQLVLSRKVARSVKAWDEIVTAHKEGTILKGKVISKTKGGLIVDVLGFETFLPGSQIDVKPITDYDQFVGKTMEFKVVKINEAIKNAVVSHKALIESDLEVQRQEIISKLEKGQVLEGTIKNITDFGAFIDLGGVDGLLYITDISWGRINHPNEVLQLNQKLNVVVLDFDDDKKRISLGLKQLTPHPWEVLDKDVKEGSKIKGKIVNIEDYGAFLEITPGVEGLIHVSEISWTNQTVNTKDYFKLGEEHEALVVTIDREERKMSLSLKKLTEDPWNSIREKYAIGSKHKGLVKNITPYGVFVDLGSEIGGMIHITDLSWTKRIKHPNEFTKVGSDLEVVVLDIDDTNRKLSLGHKQVEDDPWDTFADIFTENSVHQGTVLRKDDKGAIVQFQYGLEAFAPIKHLRKEDGAEVELDATTDFKIIEFSKEDRKVIASHSRIFEDVKNDERKEASDNKKKQFKQTKEAVKNLNKKVEKSTLGDIGALSDIKEKLQEEENKKTAKKKATEAKTEKKEKDSSDKKEEKKKKPAAAKKKTTKKSK